MRAAAPASRVLLTAVGVQLCIAGVAVPSYSFAQREKVEREFQTGSRQRQAYKSVSAETAGQINKDFARCVYRRNRKSVSELLAKSNFMRFDEDISMADLIKSKQNEGANRTSAVQQFKLDDCLGNAANNNIKLHMTASNFRSMMAEEVYLAANEEVPRLSTDAVEHVTRNELKLKVPTPEKEAAMVQAQAMNALVDCVTFKATQGADMLLRTVPGTSPERAAAIALAPVFGDCMVQGQTFKMTPLTIRALVADGMWARYAQTEH